jgi:hypothetical protein
MTGLTGQVTITNIRIPYLFYRGHIEVKELNPVGQLFAPDPQTVSITHPHVVYQQCADGPDHRNRETKYDSTSHTLAKDIS